MVSPALAPPIHDEVHVPSHHHGPGNFAVMGSAAQTRLELYRMMYLIRRDRRGSHGGVSSGRRDALSDAFLRRPGSDARGARTRHPPARRPDVALPLARVLSRQGRTARSHGGGVLRQGDRRRTRRRRLDGACLPRPQFLQRRDRRWLAVHAVRRRVCAEVPRAATTSAFPSSATACSTRASPTRYSTSRRCIGCRF